MKRHAAPPHVWLEPDAVDAARLAELRRSLGMPEEIGRILVLRGIDTPAKATAFLRPSLRALHDPGRLPDMPAAVARIETAIRRGETILVHGDYDADGLSASALLTLGLRRLGGAVETFVPHRTRDGYDLSEAGVAFAGEAGASLIVTADCGVTAIDAVRHARAEGLEVVVTDHHRPAGRLPEAVAVVDPLRPEAGYPFTGLSGVGVAFKLLEGLYLRADISAPELNQHLDLVAIGTVADQMPLVDENRILVRTGLRALARTRKPGLRALLDRVGIEAGAPVDEEHVAFRLGPRLNSVGRMADPSAGLRLLVTQDPLEARRLAVHLDEQNEERRLEDRRVLREVETTMARRFDAERDRIVILWGDDWHPGVIGIIASRLVDRLHRPVVLVSFDGDVGRGSGRSAGGFHLYDALRECEGLLERFGGHRSAAGLTIHRSRIEALAARLREVASRELGDREPVPELHVDVELRLERVDRQLHRWLTHLAPFGIGNPSPLLLVRDVAFSRVNRVGADGGHLRLELKQGESRVPGIGFGLGARLGEARACDRADVVFEWIENRWNGRSRLQARVLDFRPAAGPGNA